MCDLSGPSMVEKSNPGETEKAQSQQEISDTPNSERQISIPSGKQLIVISGAIGAGKSTILYWIKKFQEFPGWPQPAQTLCIREPWTQENSEFKLKALYDDPTKNASRFQFQVLKYYADLTHSLSYKLWCNPEGTLTSPFFDSIVCERSPLDVEKVFLQVWKMAMPENEFYLLKVIANVLNQIDVWHKANYYMINIAEHLMLQRVMERGRLEEQMLTPEILKEVHRYYWEITQPYIVYFSYSSRKIMSNNDHKDLMKIVSEILKVNSSSSQ
jgi:deoxyadenosine/deoxycytidine kinase